MGSCNYNLYTSGVVTIIMAIDDACFIEYKLEKFSFHALSNDNSHCTIFQLHINHIRKVQDQDEGAHVTQLDQIRLQSDDIQA